MSTRLSTAGLVIAVSLLGSGCAHVQLQRNTVNQAQTVSDIYQQQVLNNLAMFVYDANSLPHFAYADSGTSSVIDTAGAAVPNFNAVKIAFGLDVGRSINEAWTLKPISDPHKLTLMRCAYQKVVQNKGENCTLVDKVIGNCPDCDKREQVFFGGHAHPGEEQPCLGTCWFGFGSKQDVPKNCPCNLVGQYCGCYVWITPGRGSDELAKLTLTILDYAIYKPAARRTKEVVTQSTERRGKDGNILYRETTTRTTLLEPVKAKELTDDQMKNFTPKEIRRFRETERLKQYYPRTRSPQPRFDELRLRQRLDALAPRQ